MSLILSKQKILFRQYHQHLNQNYWQVTPEDRVFPARLVDLVYIRENEYNIKRTRYCLICYKLAICHIVENTLSISLLRTLIAISECGSFSAAADRVCISQAAVGQQMKRLEETFQITLFDRSRKTPRLNQSGKAIIPKAREIIHAYDKLLSDLTGDIPLVGELTLGAVPSSIRGLIPLSIKKLIRNYPDLHIRVVPGLSGDLLEQVERGALDAAVLSSPHDVGLNLHWQPFVEEELVLLTSPEVTDQDPHRLLKEMPYIRHTRRAAVGLLSDEWLAKNKITVRPSMEMESLETLSSMVAHNLGVSIVPNLCVQDLIFSSLRKIRLSPKATPRILGVLTRSDCIKMHLVDRLLEELERTVSEHASV